MHSYLSDIDPKAEEVYLAVLRRLSALDKARLIAEMAESGRELILLNIRKQHPEADEQEVMRYLANRMLGPALGELVYGALTEASHGDA